MNILPKKYSEFKEKSYWNNFFNQLKNTTQQNFQWYGNYFDFKEQLKKIFKHLIHKNNQLLAKHTNENKQLPVQQLPPAQQTSKGQNLSIFHIGCGKSTFGEDIQLQYPQFKVINTDYSEQIVKDMIKRSLLMKTMCKYEVCDMFQPLYEKYQQAFNVVLDKGTLDAILPEDAQEEITKIKTVFFRNVQASLNPNTYSAYVIVSMLQPFVLRTLLEHFYQKEGYEIQIQQTKIKDSKMQPFLIVIKRSPSQKVTAQKITLKLIKGNKQLNFTSIHQTMNKIQQLQQTVASQQKVKQLSPYQHLTYNISNPQQPQKMRYTLQVVDNQEQKLKLNSCGVFIVPQGKQNSYLFSNFKGLKRLIAQIATSRLIVVKLLSGNVFKSIDQVKTQINPLIQNFIQQGCDPKNVAFMTDAEQLGVRKNIYQDQNLYIEQIASGQQEAIRRVILKSNLSVVQSQAKLIYGKVEDYPHAKEVQKKSKILPAKKGKYTVIDREYLDEGYCQQIAAGLVKFMKAGESTAKGNNVMVLGGGGFCIPKFLIENVLPKPQIVTVEKQKCLCSQEVLQLFEVLQYVKSQELTVINDKAEDYIAKVQHKQSFSAIIVDISASQQQELPPRQFLAKSFILRCSDLISDKQGGLLVYNILRKNFISKDLPEIISLQLFDIVYVAMDWDQDKEQKQGENKSEEDCLVLYLIRVPGEVKDSLGKDATKVAAYGWELMGGNKQKKGKPQKHVAQLELNVKDLSWLEQSSAQIKLIYPVNQTHLKI